MIYAAARSTFNASALLLTSGMAGTLGIQIVDAAGSTVRARTTSGITEPIAGSGFYVATITLPGQGNPVAPGRYQLLWDDGSMTPGHISAEDLMLAAVVALPRSLRDLRAAMDAANAENIPVGMFVS